MHDRLLQDNPLQRLTAAQRHISLPAGKGSAGKVDNHLVEGQPLALVHRNGPGQPDGKLHESTQHILLDTLLFLVIGILDILPHTTLQLIQFARLEHDLDFLVGGNVRHDAYRAIHPPAFGIVFDKHDLSPLLEDQIEQRGQTSFREIAFDFTVKSMLLARQTSQPVFVDIVDLVATGCQGNREIILIAIVLRYIAAVQCCELFASSRVVAYLVQNLDKAAVLLAVDRLQLDRHQGHLVEHPGRKEIGIGIEAAQNIAHVGRHHRLQLIDVAHQQQLLATERQAHVARIDAQYPVDEIDHIGPHHRNFIDDNQLDLTQELALLFVVLEQVVDATAGQTQVGIVGQHGPERHLEKRMDGAAAHIDGGHSRRSQHNMLLLHMLAHILQKGRLACAGFSGKEYRLMRIANKAQGILKLFIRCIYGGLLVHEGISVFRLFFKSNKWQRDKGRLPFFIRPYPANYDLLSKGSDFFLYKKIIAVR